MNNVTYLKYGVVHDCDPWIKLNNEVRSI